VSDTELLRAAGILDDKGDYWIRQSQLTEFVRCPERFRLHVLHPENAIEGDEAFMGTADHAAAEMLLDGDIRLEDLADAVTAIVYDMLQADEPRWNAFKNGAEMAEQARRCIVAWGRDIYPKVPLVGVTEVDFAFQAGIHQGRRYGFRGCVDYPTHYGIYDWKFPAKVYKRWEKQKYDLQASIYTAAGVAGALPFEYDWPASFTFGITTRQDEPKGELVSVTRTYNHYEWVKHHAKVLIDMIVTMGMERPWPLRQEDWLCSAKWCGNYHECRGLFITPADDQ